MSHPTRFYIFLNLLHPVTAHNALLIGSFTSAGWTSALSNQEFAKKYIAGEVDYLPFSPNEASDQHFLSMYYSSAINNYVIEHNAELTRRSEFGTLPSRLSATFAFGDYADCERAAQKYSWPLSEVREFELVSGPPFTRLVRVNMEVVSLMRHATRVAGLAQQTISDVWRHYWSGGGAFQMELPGANFQRESIDSGEIWEYLIEGRLDLVGGPRMAPPTSSSP